MPEQLDIEAIRREAQATHDAHNPVLQKNGYNRCELCHYTSHPCDAYDMADTVLRLLPIVDRATRTTKTGKVLTDADIEALADEAERGYDVSHLKGKPSRERPPR